jgi:hypothetical protein
MTNRAPNQGAPHNDPRRSTDLPRGDRAYTGTVCVTPGLPQRFVGCDKDGGPARPTKSAMTFNAQQPPAASPAGPQADEPPPAPADCAQLRRAYERQLLWAADFAAAGDLQSALDARLAADAICDEMSAD